MTTENTAEKTAIQKPTPKKRRRRTALALAAPAQAAIVHLDFNTDQGYALAIKRALGYAMSNAVPQVFQGGPGSTGFANCLIALELAHRLDFPFLLVAQNLTLVDGRPSWQGKFCVALVQRQGSAFKDHGWEVHDEPAPGTKPKDSFAKRFYATRISDGQVCRGEWISVAMAKEKGWWSRTDRNGTERSHWPSMTGQMLSYRSASFWANTWDPGATMGLRSAEEELDSLDPAQSAPLLAAPPAPATSFSVLEPDLSGAQATFSLDQTAEDPTLEPGADPFAMAPELAAVKDALGKGDSRAALGIIGKIQDQNLKREAQKMFNDSRRSAR